MLPNGTIVERYQVEGRLGEGGMGTVFLVRHVTLERYHALKLIHRSHPEIVRRAKLEATSQSSFKHPNVVEMHDFLLYGSCPCMIMEYVGGEPLHHWIARHRPRPEVADVERIFAGILAGVAEAHRRGMVHRDLKPGNVLLAPDGTAKVADFGLVKVLGSTLPEHTRDGTVVGTPGYMAPEQTQNARDVDARTDVYALGCILYELLTGERLFPVGSLESAIAAQQQGLPRAIAELPPHLAPVVMACIEPDRERRPADATAVRELLGWPEGPVVGGVVVLTAPMPESSSKNTTPLTPAHGTPVPVTPPAPPPPTRTLDRWRDGLRALARDPWALGRPLGASFAVTLAGLGVAYAAWTWMGDAAAPPVAIPPMPAPEAPLLGWRAGGAALVYALVAQDQPPYATTLHVREGIPRAPAWSARLGSVELVAAWSVDWLDGLAAPEDAPLAVPDALPVPARVGPLLDAPSRFSCGFEGLPACRGRVLPPPTLPGPPGHLTLVAFPYARITVDGVDTGRKTTSTLELGAGRHEVRLTTISGDTQDLAVVVPSGGTARYCWNFEEGQPCS